MHVTNPIIIYMRVNVVVFLKSAKSKPVLDRFKWTLYSIIGRSSYVGYFADYDEVTLLRTPWYKGAIMALLCDLTWSDFYNYRLAFEDYLNDHKGNLVIAPFVDVTYEEALLSLNQWVSSINDDSNDNVMRQSQEMGYASQIHHIWNLKSGGRLVYSACDFFESTKQNIILTHIMFDLGFSRTDIPFIETVNVPYSVTPYFLYGNLNDTATFYNLLKRYLEKERAANPSMPIPIHAIDAVEDEEKARDLAAEEELVVVSPMTQYHQKSQFNYVDYSNFLNTAKLGRIVLHANVVTSTLDLFKKCRYLLSPQSDHCGIVVLAHYQNCGVGRNDNKWISPIGSLAMSFNYHLPNDVPLYNNPSIIQHMLCLAFIMAVKEPTGLANLPLYVKWPNDIYYKGDTKIGGVLVTSHLQGNQMNMVLSLGANIFNEEPTISLNEIIRRETNLKGYTYSMEEVVARVLNRLEILINAYNNDKENCHTRFEQFYLKHLLKYGKEITVIDPRIIDPSTNYHLKRKGIIRGINEFGFLRVLLVDSSEVIIVQSDGNRFDITENATIFMS